MSVVEQKPGSPQGIEAAVRAFEQKLRYLDARASLGRSTMDYLVGESVAGRSAERRQSPDILAAAPPIGAIWIADEAAGKDETDLAGAGMAPAADPSPASSSQLRRGATGQPAWLANTLTAAIVAAVVIIILVIIGTVH